MRVLFFFVGACIGSLLNVICWRSLNEEDYLFGRSHCESCGRKLEFHEMIPIISYLLMKGRCRSCNSKIDPAYPVTEFLCGSVTCIFMITGKVVILPFVYVLILISLFDRERMEFPEILLTFLFVSGIPMSGFEELLIRIISTSLLFLIFMLLRKWLGEGDMIILMIICFVSNYVFTVRVIFIASLTGLIYCIIKGNNDMRQHIPFCPFITLGFIVSALLWK